MLDGVFFLFGTRKYESRDIISSYTQAFHIPFVSPNFEDVDSQTVRPRFGSSRLGFQMFVKPSLTKALVDTIMHLQWTHFHYVYDSELALFSLQEIIRQLQKRNHHVTVRLRYVLDTDNAHEDLRALDKLKDPQNSTSKYIVINFSNEHSYRRILQQIREVGMNKRGYNYILGSLDFLDQHMERYRHGGVNITGFQLVNYSSPFVKDVFSTWKTLEPQIWPGVQKDSIHIDAALSYDAVTIIIKTLSYIYANSSQTFKHNFRRGHVYNNNKTKGIPCKNPPVPWMHGKQLMDVMRNLQFEGLTGNIDFDDHGFRKNYNFDLYNVGLNSGPEKIGDWSSRRGLRIAGHKSEVLENGTFISQTKIITTIMDSPFLMDMKDQFDAHGRPITGNDRYEGYCADLMKELSDFVGFDYWIQLVKDKTYGKRINNTDDWNGMIGELRRGEADIAVAPLSITASREEVVDFSKPFMNSGISIMIKRPEKKKPGVFSFLQPFEIQLWLCIVIGYITVGVSIFLVSRFSNAEWRRAKANSKETFNRFTLANSLWFAMGALMLQGSDETCPRSSPGRLIGGAWWFVVLICISSYTANLAAFLTIEKLLTPIDSADDLVNQNEIAYGTLDSGSTQSFFKDSKVPTYKAMWNYMKSEHPSVFVHSIQAGINRVRSSKGKYAFLLESVHNEYANNRKPCNTMKVGQPLNSNSYGIATPKGSPLRDDITYAVLSLKEDGTLIRLKKMWWIDKGECGFETGNRESKKRSLSLSNVAGIYFILIAGLVLAIIIGVLEFIYTKAKPDKAALYMLPADTQLTLVDGSQANHHETENGPIVKASKDTFVNTYTYSPPNTIGFEGFEVNTHTEV